MTNNNNNNNNNLGMHWQKRF